MIYRCMYCMNGDLLCTMLLGLENYCIWIGWCDRPMCLLLAHIFRIPSVVNGPSEPGGPRIARFKDLSLLNRQTVPGCQRDVLYLPASMLKDRDTELRTESPDVPSNEEDKAIIECRFRLFHILLFGSQVGKAEINTRVLQGRDVSL